MKKIKRIPNHLPNALHNTHTHRRQAILLLLRNTTTLIMKRKTCIQSWPPNKRKLPPSKSVYRNNGERHGERQKELRRCPRTYLHLVWPTLELSTLLIKKRKKPARLLVVQRKT